MSTNAMESALWDMHHDPAREQRLVKALDVRAMADRGADQMLLFVSFIALSGFDQVGEYMRRMNTPSLAAA